MGSRVHPGVCRTCGIQYLETAARVAKGDFNCLPCRRAADAKWRKARKDSGRPVVSAKMGADYHKAYQAEYRAKAETKSRRAALARQYVNDPDKRHKHEARWEARRAVASGRLQKQPCEVCGAEKVEAHHDDYSMPLAVRWLCRPHHREHHKARGEAK